MNILELTQSILMSAASSPPSQHWGRARFVSQWCHRMISWTEEYTVIGGIATVSQTPPERVK